jgi:hypothetical protein
MYGCHGYGGKQNWVYDETTKTLKHGKNCFVHVSDSKAEVGSCDSGDSAKWEWVHIEKMPAHARS